MNPRRWRVKALDQAPCELFFSTGIDRESLQMLYRGCHIEEIADTDQAAPPSKEADDET